MVMTQLSRDFINKQIGPTKLQGSRSKNEEYLSATELLAYIRLEEKKNFTLWKESMSSNVNLSRPEAAIFLPKNDLLPPV
jgi:hypothetical protein